jgi:hypothetical protein
MGLAAVALERGLEEESDGAGVSAAFLYAAFFCWVRLTGG